MSRTIVAESVRDYIHRKEIRAVVNHLLDQEDDDIPEDLDWSEARAYHQALLSAYKVRPDYALFLMDAWDAIWKPALAGFGINEECPISELIEDHAGPSPNVIWNDCFYGSFIDPRDYEASVYTSIVLDGEKGLIIHFKHFDADGESTVSDQLELPAPWKSEPDTDEDDYRVTQARFAVPPRTSRSSTSVDWPLPRGMPWTLSYGYRSRARSEQAADVRPC